MSDREPDPDPDLVAEEAEKRLRRRREQALRGDWDGPGEFLNAEHEAEEEPE